MPTATTDPVIRDAINMRDGLLHIAKEFRMQGEDPRVSATRKELAAIDAKYCEDAAEMLQKLGTEVDRLRMGIGGMLDYHMSRGDLRQMTRNWNN